MNFIDGAGSKIKTVNACHECMTYFVTYYGFHLIKTAYLASSINTRTAYCATLLSCMNVDKLTFACTKRLATVPKNASKATKLNSC
jgi:hypothetical protein